MNAGSIRSVAVGTCLLLALSLGATSCSEPTQLDNGAREVGGTLRIYSSLPLQGDARPQSEDIVRAMELALDQENGKAGEVEIEYISLDDARASIGSWHPKRVQANARRAAADPTTVAYLGDFNSGASMFSIPILNEAGILQVSPSNTYAGLTRTEGGSVEGEPDKYYPTGERTYGRVVPADHVQAAAQVTYMKEQGCTDVFIVNDGDVYGGGLAAEVEATAAEQNLPVLRNIEFDDQTDFKVLADKVSAASPDCFFFGGITMNGAADMTRFVSAAVPDLKMFYPDGCAETAFTEHIPKALEHRVFITNPTLDRSSYPPTGREFYDAFKTRYGTDPEPYAIYGYEAMKVVLDSIERAGDAVAATGEGRGAIIDAFFQTEARDSVLGTYDIDRFGDTTLSAYGGYRVDNGLVVFDHVLRP